MDLVLTDNGRKRTIRRLFRFNCLRCGASLTMPVGENFWVWSKSDVCEAFLMSHYKHANPSQVGAEVGVIEDD